MSTELEARLRQDNDLYLPPFPDPPPGMTGEDVPLYRAWLKKPTPSPLRAYYNVRVGPTLAELAGKDGPDARLQAQLLALRMDMLVFDGKTWTIIEFHGQAALPQLGRLVAYPDLLRNTYDFFEPIKTLLVAQNVNPYVLPLFNLNGIPVLTYPDLITPVFKTSLPQLPE
jgi:hypothetical protein